MQLPPESLYESAKYLLNRLGSYSREEREQIMEALFYAAHCHGSQRRKSGLLYIVHPIEVAALVAGLGCDTSTVCAALLHDLLEDTAAAPEDIKKRFGDDTYALTEAVTRHPMFSRKEYFEKLHEKSKRDIRIAIIKLADQYSNHSRQSQLALKKESHHQNVEELNAFYIDQLATIPDIPKELVRLVKQAAKESHSDYLTRHL